MSKTFFSPTGVFHSNSTFAKKIRDVDALPECAYKCIVNGRDSQDPNGSYQRIDASKLFLNLSQYASEIA